MRKLFSTRVSENALSFALFIFRLGIGGLMIANHGWDKISHFGQKASRFKYDLFGLGQSASFSMLVFAEFFCAAFIILGLFTRLAAIPLIIAMSVAFVSAHKMSYDDGETSLMFLICFVVLLITGPGKISLDKFIGK